MCDYFNQNDLVGIENYVVKTKNSGEIKVYVQGELHKGKRTFITVHDLGANHRSMVSFVNCPIMSEIKKEACFLHVVVPGHEDNAPDLCPDNFPSLKALGQDLIYVLDFFRAPPAIGIGDGAGAIVLSYLALLYAFRIPMLVLCNCAAIIKTPSNLFRDNFTGWRAGKMTAVESFFLSHHKYGIMGLDGYQSIFRCVIALTNYKAHLHKVMNHDNVKLYVRAFLLRENLILRGCRAQLLFMAGSLSPYAPLENLNGEQYQNACYLDTVNEVADVISEAPGTVVRKILKYCQKQDLFTTAPSADLGCLGPKRMSAPSTIIGRF